MAPKQATLGYVKTQQTLGYEHPILLSLMGCNETNAIAANSLATLADNRQQHSNPG